jgi:hypothetical protein
MIQQKFTGNKIINLKKKFIEKVVGINSIFLKSICKFNISV